MNNFQAEQETIGEQNAGTIDDVDVAPAVIPEQSEPVSVKSPLFICAWCRNNRVSKPVEICEECELKQAWDRICDRCGTRFDSDDPERWHCCFCRDALNRDT